MTYGAKNHPHDRAKNRPQDSLKNRPDIINPVCLCGVIVEADLKALLNVKRQSAWCSRVRLCGLLLLIDYICRNLKRNRITISADLAHSFVSKIRKRDRPNTITEPLLLLCEIGILRRKHPAVFAHVRASAIYCFAAPYRETPVRFAVDLPPKLANKLKFAGQRCEKRLNRKYPFRKQLLTDLRAVSFAMSARPIIARELSGKNNLRALMTAVDCGNHSVRVSERGQITTSISSCPRELQPHLLSHGSPIVCCDISNAHWNFLPLILTNRLLYVSHESAGREKYVNDGWREHNRLIALLSDGDFYRTWCVDPQNDGERDQKKNLLTILLNQKNEKCQQNRLYQRIRAAFPITFAIVEDIKRDDHRNLSKQLQRFTADAIAAALLEVQQKGIAAIPHVDALICQEIHHATVCEAIGRQIFKATGVCSTVGGIRYSPLTESEKQALAFDEIAPSDDGMSYDQWEEIRAIKTAAVLKLTRFTSHLCELDPVRRRETRFLEKAPTLNHPAPAPPASAVMAFPSPSG